MHPELEAHVDELMEGIRSASEGTGSMEVLLCAWKEKLEMRKAKHADAWSTRHFLVSDFAMLIVFRRVLAPFILRLHRLPLKLKEMIIGINAMDPHQWGAILWDLLEMGGEDRLAGLDISGLDLNERLAYMLYMAGGIRKALVGAGCPPRRATAMALCFIWPMVALHRIDTVYVWAFMKFPSGVWVTGENNSLYNGHILRSCYAKSFITTMGLEVADLWRGLVPPFRDMVCARLYGDDNG